MVLLVSVHLHAIDDGEVQRIFAAEMKARWDTSMFGI